MPDETEAFHIWPLTAEVTLRGDHEGDPRITVLHFRHGSAQPTPTISDLNDLCAEVRDHPLVALMNCCSNLTRWTEVRAVYHGNSSALQGSVFLPTTYIGGRTGDALTGNPQVVLAKHGSNGLRRALGRVNVMDITEGDQNDNVINSNTELALLTIFGSTLLTSLVTTNQSWRLVVASRKFNTTSDVQSLTFQTLMKGLNTRRKGYHKHKRRPTPT